MAIKKQKRSSDAAGLAQNGESSKKALKPSDKIEKAEKQTAAQKKLQRNEKKAPSVSAAVKKEIAKPKVNEAKRAAKLLEKKENRKEARKEMGQYKPEMMNLSAAEIEARIEAIKSREEISRTAKRKLSVLKKKLAILNGTFVPTVKQTKGKKSLEQGIKKKVAAEGGASALKKKIAQKMPTATKLERQADKEKKAGKGKETNKAIVEKEESEESVEDDDDDDNSGEEITVAKDGNSNVSAEDNDDDSEEAEEEDEEDEEDDGDDDDDDDDDDDAETKYALAKGKNAKKSDSSKAVTKKENEKASSSNGEAGKKKRFVLFVGNLPYEASVDEIKKHFLTKVGKVSSVRIPTMPGTKAPRGIAYVELANETDYQKGLALHHTSINGRRINVQYTQSGSKSAGKKSEIVSKNKKLHAMRKSGMLAGKRDDRNDRRKKQKTT